MSEEIKDTIKDLNVAFEAFKEKNDDRLAQLESKGDVDPITRDEFAKVNDDVSDLSTKLDLMNAKLDRPTLPEGKADRLALPEAVEHKAAFESWIRSPEDPETQTALKEAERAAISAKAVDTTADATGGYAVPEQIASNILKWEHDMSPMRQNATVVQVGSRDYKQYVDRLGEASGWVGETGTRSETDTPNLGERAPTFGMVYAYPKATEESLDDMFFNVEAWISEFAGRNMAKAEGTAFITGNGTNKPSGLTKETPLSTDDDASPLRAIGVLEYIPTGVAAGFKTLLASSPYVNPADTLIETMYTLQATYRMGAKWSMNKSTMSTVRQWKDADANYIWQPSLISGQPSSLLGYEVVEDEEFADVGANAYPIAFGDFRRGYLICDLVGLRMTRDEITTPGYVKFYIRKRVGGIVLDDRAIKLIKIAAS